MKLVVGTRKEPVRSGALARIPQKRNAKLRLFCFPYAGGSSAIFRDWQQALPEEVEVCPVQLPGHERRLSEQPFTSVGPLVRNLVPDLQPWLDRPFAFFGHSLGALVAFESARTLRALGQNGPAHLLVSGFRGPHLDDIEPPYFDLPAHEFVERLRTLKGTPDAVLENQELLDMMLPVIRSDFQIAQTYRHQPEPPLETPITAFGGLHDREVPADDLLAWRQHTSAAFEAHLLPGDHFFLHTTQRLLLNHVSDTLAALADAR